MQKKDLKATIPPPSKAGSPTSSPLRPILEKLKQGQYVTCESRKEQGTVYACGVRMGYTMAKRTVKKNGLSGFPSKELRVYIVQK